MSTDTRLLGFAQLLAETPPDDHPRLFKYAKTLGGSLASPEALAAAGPQSLVDQTVSLDQLIREGVPPVKFLPSPSLGRERIFYGEGHVSIVSGHKKSGKSWMLAQQAIDCVRAEQHVLYLDLENGENLFAERMSVLRNEGETLDEHFHYVPFPKGLNLSTAEAEISAAIDRWPGALVVIDSFRGWFARLKPSATSSLNDPDAIESVFGPLTAAAKRNGATVIVIDHTKKDGSEHDEYATANSGAKEAVADAVYFFVKVKPYSEDVEGYVRIRATSDRRGKLDFTNEWWVGGQGPGRSFGYRLRSAEDMATGSGHQGEIIAFLKRHAGQHFTKTQVREEVRGDNNALGVAIDALADDPNSLVFADTLPGSRHPQYVWNETRTKSARLEP